MVIVRIYFCGIFGSNLSQDKFVTLFPTFSNDCQFELKDIFIQPLQKDLGSNPGPILNFQY